MSIDTTDTTTLVKRTLRTVGLLVLACVLFVGALSAIAVSVTSRALGKDTRTTTEASSEAAPGAAAPKKPLSI